MPMYLDHKLCK